jgi:SAM-dependent methyltransferase
MGGCEMLTQWMRVWQARSWMKRNQGFLPTWHAYVGYKMGLFEYFESAETIEQVVTRSGYDQTLVESWLEVGVAVGHMRKIVGNKWQSSRKMCRYFIIGRPHAVGELLIEMMELHLPALLQYPQLMVEGARRSYDEHVFARTVASTSALIEEAAFPVLRKWVKKRNCQTIIDIGCGYAGYLMRLARADERLHLFGVEKNEQLLNAAQMTVRAAKQGNVHLVHGDFLLESDPLKNLAADRFDLIMMNNILYYFSPAERIQVLHRAAAMLNQKGSVTIICPLRNEQTSVPFATAFHSFLRAHDNLFDLPSLDDLKGLAKQVGLQLQTSHPLIKEGNWYFCGFTKQ